jgi:iron complex outermembrane receptor protein
MKYNTMVGKWSLTGLILLLTLGSFAQQALVKGTVKDKSSGELLIGVNVMYAPGKGAITDVNGNFTLNIPYGTYTFTVSYVGYEQSVRKIEIKKEKVKLNFQLINKTLKEVEIVSDIARSRETPVAFSTIKPAKLQEELAAQDLPMILNSTPGVYATQQGGGDGDARINIRGFNQRNVAVMIDGIPVNDMENGWVYWSNWSGLDLATRSIQVQRGLGASKLALPSVGGTMNILTKGIDSKRSFRLQQEIGNDGYSRTSLAMNTGRMKNGWGVSFTGYYKRGNGWVDMTWTRGYFFFLRVDKSLGNHLLSFSAIGSPQSHGQRSYKSSIAEFSTDFANKAGVADSNFISGRPTNLGLRYNQNWGYLNRWTIVDGDTIQGTNEKINEKTNYYFKPQFSLRDFWNLSEKVYVSNILYLSLGNGGGTGLSRTLPVLEDGTKDIQSSYNSNIKNLGTELDGTGDILRSSINNHIWYGFLSSFGWKIHKGMELSGGIDLRSYRGEHYREVYDLLGQTRFIDKPTNIGGEMELNDKTNPSRLRGEGDIIGYHNDGIVRWSGLFTQFKATRGNWSYFINLTAAYSGYKRVDYFRNKDLVIDGEVFEQAVGYKRQFVFPDGWVAVVDTFEHNGQKYTINSPEARTSETPWKWIFGYTAKGGVNYNISETMNVFANAGYLNKAPRFANVFDNNNREYKEIRNEHVTALELGYSYYNEKLTVNLNSYWTQWQNKPADYPSSVIIDDIVYRVNINGMDALHRGVEAEIGYRITKNILSETVISIGDWRWTSADSAEIIDDVNGNVIDKIYFDAQGLKVGDAAQTQLRESIRWQVTKGLYIKAAVTYFGDFYSNFDPMNMDPVKNPSSFDEEGNPIQSWKIPAYALVDGFAGYRFKYKELRFDLRLSILNVLDQVYISDAQNNDRYVGQSWNSFDARSAAVFFGMGRRFMTTLSISF